MYRTIDRYILREIAQLFILILFILTFVLLMGKILQLMDLIINKGLGLLDVTKLFVYLLPSFLIFTLPISFLISILVGIGRISADNELVALKAAGVGLTRLLPAVGSMALVLFFLTALVGMVLFPHGNRATKNLLFQLAMQKASIGIKEKVFNSYFHGILIYAETIPPHGNYMEGVIISDRRLIDEPGTFYAKRAYLVSDPGSKVVFLRLENGSLHLVDAKLNSYRRMEFRSYDVQLNLGASLTDAGVIPGPTLPEMTILDLWQKMKSAGQNLQAYREAALELNKRFTIPVSCIVFGLLGIPLSIRAHRSVKARGLTISLLIVLCYYLIQMSGDALVEKGWIPIWLGTWTPNLLFFTLGTALFFLAEREIHLSLAMPARFRNILKPPEGSAK
ncbi:MAG: LPS export ABC transporter permease LptF [Smithellaceae bacterium]|nr:LPS export ABC transporter permease LptF [Smithellaceae bacterium]